MQTSDFINVISTEIKDYLSTYLTNEGFDVQVDIGWPNFDGMLPLTKAHVTIMADEDMQIFSPCYDDVVDLSDDIPSHVSRGKLIEMTVDIDTWTSRGLPTRPSKSGGKTGGNRIASYVIGAFTVDETSFFDACPNIDDIIRCSNVYSRNPASFDTEDIFQVHTELVIRIIIE